MLFFILSTPIKSALDSDIKVAACLCLQEFANVRQGLFEPTEQRIEYVKNLAQNMIMLLRSPAKQLLILKDKVLFKEFVKIP